MKVKTGLKSGSLLSEASTEVNKALYPITDFVSDANIEAEKITRSLADSWNCVTNAIKI